MRRTSRNFFSNFWRAKHTLFVCTYTAVAENYSPRRQKPIIRPVYARRCNGPRKFLQFSMWPSCRNINWCECMWVKYTILVRLCEYTIYVPLCLGTFLLFSIAGYVMRIFYLPTLVVTADSLSALSLCRLAPLTPIT